MHGPMDFDERLRRAIQRGSRRRDLREEKSAEHTLTQEELRSLHTQYRLKLSEKIEACLSRLPDHFPGFKHETLMGEQGWGAAVSRDDVGLAAGARDNFYSRLEMVVRPYAAYHVLELAAKGTIRNREAFNRKHFQKLDEVDLDTFEELIDIWVVEYAELYATKE